MAYIKNKRSAKASLMRGLKRLCLHKFEAQIHEICVEHKAAIKLNGFKYDTIPPGIYPRTKQVLARDLDSHTVERLENARFNLEEWARIEPEIRSWFNNVPDIPEYLYQLVPETAQEQCFAGTYTKHDIPQDYVEQVRTSEAFLQLEALIFIHEVLEV